MFSKYVYILQQCTCTSRGQIQGGGGGGGGGAPGARPPKIGKKIIITIIKLSDICVNILGMHRIIAQTDKKKSIIITKTL